MTRHRPTEPGIAGSSHVGVIVRTHCPRSRASPAGGRQTENLQVSGAPPLPSTFGHARRTALLRWARGGVALQIARCSSIPRHAKQLLSCRGNTPPPTRHQPGAQDGVALRGRELSLGLLRGRRKYYPQYYRGLAWRFVLLQLSALLLAASSTRASGLILCWGRRVFSHCIGLVVGGANEILFYHLGLSGRHAPFRRPLRRSVCRAGARTSRSNCFSTEKYAGLFHHCSHVG